MKGTTRPSDATRSTPTRPGGLVGRLPRHGDVMGDLVVEGEPFRDSRRRMCVNVRCVALRHPRVVVVYHLVTGRHPRCTACRERRWNRATACRPPRPQNYEGSK